MAATALTPSGELNFAYLLTNSVFLCLVSVEVEQVIVASSASIKKIVDKNLVISKSTVMIQR